MSVKHINKLTTPHTHTMPSYTHLLNKSKLIYNKNLIEEVKNKI